MNASWLLERGPVILISQAVFAALATASLVSTVGARMRLPIGAESVRRKIRSWWLIAGFVLVAVALGGALQLVALAFLCFLALKEYFTLIPTTASDRGCLFWAYLALPIQFVWIHLEWFGMFTVFIPTFAFLLLQTRLVIAGDTRDFVARSGRICWGLFLFVHCLGHAAYLVTLGEPGDAVTGSGLFLYLVVVTALGDIGGFVFGKAFGRRRVAPSVSPGKTLAGFLGAVLVTTVVGAELRFLTPFGALEAAGFGALIGLAGILGDLCVSALKRDVGVKDSSQFIPGHGGVLDRVDSLCFSAPVFLHLVRYIYF